MGRGRAQLADAAQGAERRRLEAEVDELAAGRPQPPLDVLRPQGTDQTRLSTRNRNRVAPGRRRTAPRGARRWRRTADPTSTGTSPCRTTRGGRCRAPHPRQLGLLVVGVDDALGAERAAVRAALAGEVREHGVGVGVGQQPDRAAGDPPAPPAAPRGDDEIRPPSAERRRARRRRTGRGRAGWNRTAPRSRARPCPATPSTSGNCARISRWQGVAQMPPSSTVTSGHAALTRRAMSRAKRPSAGTLHDSPSTAGGSRTTRATIASIASAIDAPARSRSVAASCSATEWPRASSQVPSWRKVNDGRATDAGADQRDVGERNVGHVGLAGAGRGGDRTRRRWRGPRLDDRRVGRRNLACRLPGPGHAHTSVERDAEEDGEWRRRWPTTGPGQAGRRGPARPRRQRAALPPAVRVGQGRHLHPRRRVGQNRQRQPVPGRADRYSRAELLDRYCGGGRVQGHRRLQGPSPGSRPGTTSPLRHPAELETRDGHKIAVEFVSKFYLADEQA